MTAPDPAWLRVETADGSFTLAHPDHGETCHSRAGAWTESRERYARSCRVHERALELARAGASRFRLLDVGTGLGLNLAAALEALEGTGLALDAVSLECDERVIRATLAAGASALPELERRHAPVRDALARALARPPGTRVACGDPATGAGSLRLVLGDARATLRRLPPDERFDAVFLDPFSPRVDPPLWEPQFLAAVAERMARGSLLATYTVSARVRAGLLAAGLAVAPLGRVGTKAGGTLASPDRVLDAFDARTARRLRARVDRLRAGASEIPPRWELPQGG